VNIWISTVPAFLLAAIGALVLLRYRRKSGLLLLVGVNAAVLVGALNVPGYAELRDDVT